MRLLCPAPGTSNLATFLSVQNIPKILILAGPNGAGKTTFAREYVRKVLGFRRFVNADLIATGMSPFDPSLATISAARVMLGEIKQLVKEKESFALETTLSGLGYARHIPTWKNAGYQISLIFLSLESSSIAKKRVRNRVKQGGHDIPVATIERRFESGLKNFNERYKQIVDDWQLYDNTGIKPELIDWKK